MDSGFPIRNLDTGEVLSQSMFDDFGGLAPANSSSAPPASEADRNAFQKLFAALGKEDVLYHALKCRLWESLSSFHSRKAKKRHQGVMFISSKHLCFAEENAQRKPVKIGIPLHEIVNLTSEDFGLSEGVVVSTMRDTKFYFEQFSSRREAFDGIMKAWKRPQPNKPPSPSHVFDPLGGFSAVTASHTSSSHTAEATKSSSMFSVPKPEPSPVLPPPPVRNQSTIPPSRPQPAPSRPVPPPSKRSTSDILPTAESSRNPPHSSTVGILCPPLRTRSTSAAKSSHVGEPIRINPDLIEFSQRDSWFSTLTKIYYRLGKFNSLTIPPEYLDKETDTASNSKPVTAAST